MKSPLSPQDQFQHLHDVISSPRFLSKQGPNNDIPFFICPFDPKDAVDMERLRGHLVNQLEKKGIRILEINLYDLSIELLKSRNIWEQVLELEPTVPKEQLKELLQGVLDPQDHLIPAMAERMDGSEFDVMFLSGIGEVFPYIRSHNVLNNLQSTAKDKPTLMFFPGDYTHSEETGASLDLFKRLHDDKYYRAFDISHYEV